MTPMHRVFVATDGSAPAEAAELVAADLGRCLAACHGACEVVVATVIPPREGSIVEVPYRGTVPAAIQRVLPTPEMEEQAESLVAEAGVRIRERAGSDGVAVRALVLRGASPAQGILEFLEEQEVDFVVVGNRGHGGFKKLVLGSVSNEILHSVGCPVIIVKAQEESGTE